MDNSNKEQQSLQPYTEFFSWGDDSYGQLALANAEENENSNSYYSQRKYYDQPKSLSFDILISQISCGDYHSAFISGDGLVFTVGKNMEGQLGIGDPTLPYSTAPLLVDQLPKEFGAPKMLSCGGNHCAVIMQNGDLYTWGCGQQGQLGNGQIKNLFQPQIINNNGMTRYVYVDCGIKNTLTINQYGKVLVSGDNSFRQLGIPTNNQIKELTEIDFQYQAKQIAAGNEHSLILTEDSRVFVCGNNRTGNLGLGHQYSSDNFLLVNTLQNLKINQIAAGRHSAAITEDRRLFVWGQVFKGDNLLLPQELRSNKLMKMVSVGETMSAVIDEDNQIYTWGTNNSQQNQMPQLVGELSQKEVQQVCVGLDFVIALGQDFDEFGEPFQEFNKKEITKQCFPERKPEQEDSFPRFTRQNQEANQQRDYSNYTKTFNYNNGRTIEEKDPISIQQQSVNHHLANDKIQTPYSQLQQLSYVESEQIIQNQNNQSVLSNDSKRVHDQNSQVRNFQRKSYNSQNNSFVKPPVEKQQDAVVSLNTQKSGFSNADLYRQIDMLREENHQIKQKNRELMQTINSQKEESQQIVDHADQEIKRMSDFVDQYTKEIDQTKFDMEKDYEEKLNNEKRIAEELKQKMHEQQNEIEMKLDNLQNDIETLRNDNVKLQQEKSELQQQKRELEEKLKDVQRNLDQIQSKQREVEKAMSVSPISHQKITRNQYQTLDYQQKTPNSSAYQQNFSNYKSRIQGSQPKYQREQRIQQENLQQDDRDFNNFSQRQEKSPLSSYQRDYPQQEVDTSSYYSRQQFQNRENYPVVQRTEFSIRKEPASPFAQQNQFYMNKSPIPNENQEKVFQPIDPQCNRQNFVNEDERCFRERNTFHNNYQNLEKIQSVNQKDNSYINQKSPISTNRTQIYNGMNTKFDSNISSIQVEPRKNEGKENNTSTIQTSGVSDVKQRLASMQKNKEELEQKLKSYEAKIRQHFNR